MGSHHSLELRRPVRHQLVATREGSEGGRRAVALLAEGLLQMTSTQELSPGVPPGTGKAARLVPTVARKYL